VKSDKFRVLLRAITTPYIRELLTGSVGLLARIVQSSLYEKTTLEPADLLEQLTPGEPVIFAVSHTGRFVDVTSVLFHLLPKNSDGIQIITWDGFVKEPEIRELFRMLPLDNQLSRQGKTKSEFRDLLAKIRHQIQDIQTAISSGKWIIIFPSEICGAGRHENPWKTGASELAYNEVVAKGSCMKIVLLGISYENYTVPALSQILIRGKVLNITPDLDAKAIHRLMVEHEKQLMVWHLDYFPTYEDALPFLTGASGAGNDESNVEKWNRLLRYSPTGVLTALQRSIATRELDEKVAKIEFTTIVEAAKTRMTKLEDILISLLGRHHSVYERTVKAHAILEYAENTNTFDESLLEYRRLCLKAGIPVGRDNIHADFKVLTAGLLLLPAGMLVHGIGRICLALLPASTMTGFYRRDNELQFRGQNLFLRSTAGWSSLHFILAAVGALVAILIFQLALAEELLIGLGLGVLIALITVTSAVFTYKYGWMFKLLWLRTTRSKTLRQIRRSRAAIRAAILG
jgi:hypothetical protein